MIRLLGSICFTALVFAGSYWAWQTQAPFRQFINEHFQTGEFLTLEIRYSAEQIMEREENRLLKNEEYSYLRPSLQFFPYALLEVKYVKENRSTGEGLMLWGLEDGEMVIDTENWLKTHGYQDCILSNADRYDFKIINTLAKHNGSLDRESLLSKLYVESDILDNWLESAKSKHLIIQNGNDYRLHFEKPLLQKIPESKIRHRLVTKPFKHSKRTAKKYHISQIEEIAKIAFGSGFSIRQVKEVYLPVHIIEVKNPDGSIHSSQWNAVTGKTLDDPFMD